MAKDSFVAEVTFKQAVIAKGSSLHELAGMK